MNKVKSLLACLWGLDAGMQINSSIWNPKPDNFLMIALCVSLALVFIILTKEPAIGKKWSE